MDEDADTVFRLDNEVLAFRFTATLSARRAEEPRERLVSSDRLRLWLTAARLDPGAEPSPRALRSALALREAIHRIGTALAFATAPENDDIALLNATAADGAPAPALTGAGIHWNLRPAHAVADALAVVARDAIRVFGAPGTARITTCEGEDCGGLFLDTSRGSGRRWCYMNTCGNRAKKARMRER